MDANTPAKNKWRRWARQYGCCLGDGNEQPESNKPILEIVADSQNTSRIPPTSNNITSHANGLPTTSSSPEAPSTIQSTNQQGNIIQANGDSSLVANRISPDTSGAVAIEGTNVCTGPQDVTGLGSSGANKINLWGKALGKIQKSQGAEIAEAVKTFVQTLDDSQSEPLESARELQKQMQKLVTKKEANTESEAWTITIGQKEYRVREYVEKTTAILEKFAGTVNTFTGAVDVAVSFDPAHAALPWAAVRLVLTAVIAVHEFKGRVALGLAKVAVLISQSHIYQRFYMASEISIELDKSELDSLEEAIVDAYTQSILLLVFVHKYRKSKMLALNASWKLSDMEEYLENLKYADDGLIQAANNCQQSLANKTGDKVRQVVDLLGDFGTEIHKQRELIVDIRQRALLSELKNADGAAYDSLAEQNEPRCHKETRIELLRAVQNWMDTSEAKPIYWLQGNAGTGKSTISRTVAEKFDAKGKLGASFFFKRGRGDRSSSSRFFTTISSQLCCNRPLFAQSVAKAIDEDRDLVTSNSQKQFKKLILEPLQSMARELITRVSILVVVDALDECEEDDHVRFMIQSLDQIRMLREGGVDLRIFITSRPEVHIQRGFQQILDCHKEVVLHDISGHVIQQDIAMYLKDELSSIIKQHKIDLGECGQPVDETWPSDESIQRLAKMAKPLFIVAATVCRLLDCDDPYNEFSHIISQGEKSYDGILNETYRAALGRVLKGQEDSSAEDRRVRHFQMVVGSIVLLEEPLSVSALGQLLCTSSNAVWGMVKSVGSVLNVPPDEKSPVKTFHLSFREFLINKQRNTITKLQIDEDETHNDLANKCLELLLKSTILKKDVCGLGELDKRNCDVPQKTIDEKISTQVQYACRYWIHHIKKSKVKVHDEHLAYNFLKKHFLHWLEVLSLIGRLPESIGLIRELRESVDPNSGEKLSEFLHDANRFILHSMEAIIQTPLQLHSSALLFAPRQSIVRQLFEGDISWVLQKPPMEEDWSACLQTIEHEYKEGGSVAVSGNGKQIAHGAKEKAVSIRDAATGVLQKTLECEDQVASVVFCHDDELIAARLDDGAIKIWNAATGRLQRTLRGGDDGFPQHGAFTLASSNSRLIASASNNGTIEIFDASTGVLQKAWKGHELYYGIWASFLGGRLVIPGTEGTINIWDATTGELQHTLTTSNSRWVTGSLAISRDGSLLASTSFDKAIRIWDTGTWEQQSTLRGHTSDVYAVAFSSDNNLLASGSHDETIKIWDLATRTLQRTLTGHNRSVSWIAFPENNLLVSASVDKTIKIWDLTQAKPQHTFESHTDQIISIDFSTRSGLVASASADETVKVWDATTGSLKYTLNGHGDSILSVAFSADSKLVASASRDKTVKVWDATTGSLKYTLNGHGDSILSVPFSADSKLVASASSDKTVKVWDATTGSLKYTLNGHTESINSVVFSADSKLVASASRDHTVKVWDATTGSLKYTLNGHGDSILSVAFSADSKLVASASRDKTVKVWDAKEATVKITLCVDESHSHLSFSDTNSLVLQAPGHSMININAILERGEAQAVVHIDKKTESSTNDLLETKSPAQNGVTLQPSGYSLSRSNEWVTCRGQQVVWLPPTYRPGWRRTVSTSSEMIAIGSVKPYLIGGFEKWWT